MSARSPVFVAWTNRTGRATEIAEALGGDALCVFPSALSARKLVLFRYLVSVFITWVRLTRRNPSAVVVTHPPVVAASAVFLWCKVTKKPFAIDAHPTAFGAKGNVVSRLTLPLHRFMARHCVGVLVASPTWGRIVESWRAKPLVVHEAPRFQLIEPPSNKTPVIVFPGIFASDEPVEELLKAAAELKHCQFRVFGDTRRAPEGLVESAPANVTFTGWLESDDYRSELEKADIVVSLTTEPGSVMRAACEAVFMGRPLVCSDSADLRSAFSEAVFVQNDARSLTEGLDYTIQKVDELNQRAKEARRIQLARWESQLAALRLAIDERGK